MAALILPLCILVLVMASASFAEWSLRRDMRKCAATPCPACGKAIGLLVLQQAREQNKVTKIIKAQPTLRLKRRLVSGWNFACPNCHAEISVRPMDWEIQVRGPTEN